MTTNSKEVSNRLTNKNNTELLLPILSRSYARPENFQELLQPDRHLTNFSLRDMIISHSGTQDYDVINDVQQVGRK